MPSCLAAHLPLVPVVLPPSLCGPEGHVQKCGWGALEKHSPLFPWVSPLPKDAVTCSTEWGQLLHSPESIKCSQKCLIKMLSLETYSAVGIVTLCAGRMAYTPTVGKLPLMVHGDSLWVWLNTATGKKGQPCRQTLSSGLEGWWALLTLLTLACSLSCVAGWPCSPWQHLPWQVSAPAHDRAQQQAQLVAISSLAGGQPQASGVGASLGLASSFPKTQQRCAQVHHFWTGKRPTCIQSQGCAEREEQLLVVEIQPCVISSNPLF